jgi:hypothetical protein
MKEGVLTYQIRRAIRLSMLCNPTGKPGKFRAIDWLVEHNNLYLKVINLSSNAIFSETNKIEKSEDLWGKILKPYKSKDFKTITLN